MAISVGSVSVQVVPDASRFNALLKEKLRDLTATIRLDVDTAGATARLDEVRAKVDLLGAKSPSIKVDVDSAGAVAQLAAVGAEADRTADKNRNLGNSGSSASGGLSLLMKTAIGLSPALVPVGAAALGVAAALGTMAAAGAAGVGVLGIALASVTSAVKLLGQQQTAQTAASAAAASGAAAHAQAIVSAERQIQSAEMSLGDARRQAANSAIQSAQQVASAQYGLIQADQQEQQALQALQSAREAATRQLTSMANAAVDARLAERQAVLDLETATTNYRNTMASATATQQQRDQASLDLAKAQQHLTEAHQANTYAQVDNAKAQKLGVDGAPQVVSAAQAVAAAQHNQQVATQSLANAQRAAADQQIQSAESIKRAQQGVAAAMDAMAAAQRSANTSASLAAINAQVAALDPAVRSFAEYLRGTWTPIWKQVQSASSGGLLPGLRAGMDAVRPLMPAFIAFIRDISSRLGDMARNVGQAFASPFWQQFFQFLTRTMGPALSSLGTVLGNIATGFAGIWMAFEPIIKPITDGIVGISGKFADFGKQASTSAGFGKFVQYVKDSLPLVGKTVGDILRAVGEAVVALAPLGRPILMLLDQLAKFLANVFIPFLAPIVKFIADQLAPVFSKILAGAIAGARFAFGLIMQVVKDNRPELEQLWSFIKNYLAPVLGFTLKVAFGAVGAAIALVIGVIARMIDAWNWLWGVGKGIGHWFATDFVGFFEGAWSKISSGWRDLVKEIGGLWQNLKHYLMDPVAFVVRYVINDGLINAWDWVVSHLHLPGSWHADPMKVPAVPPLAMAAGGVLPGYTPGRDVHQFYSPTAGSLALSGGEAIMVPEWTRAVGGPAAVRQMNAAARGQAFAGGGVWDFVTNLLPGVASAKAMSPQMNALMSDPVTALKSLVASAMGGLSSATPMLGMLGDVVGGLVSGVGQSIKDSLLSLISVAGGNFGAGSAASAAPSSQAANVAIVKSWAGPYAWDSGAEWDALVSVINRESGFRNTAQNPTSSAYGMFQFLDSTWASLGFSKTSDPVRQAMAGMKYISGRYGDPLAALRHEQAFGWYDQGGLLPPGPSLVYNGTGGPELIAPRHTFEQIINGSSGGARGPASFTGNLYLDSGEFLGKVRGEAEQVVTEFATAQSHRGTYNP